MITNYLIIHLLIYFGGTTGRFYSSDLLKIDFRESKSNLG